VDGVSSKFKIKAIQLLNNFLIYSIAHDVIQLLNTFLIYGIAHDVIQLLYTLSVPKYVSLVCMPQV
jgi:hypothetical protein